MKDVQLDGDLCAVKARNDQTANQDLNLTPQGTGNVASANDCNFTGGYRQPLEGWYQDNVAASQTNVPLNRWTTSGVPTGFPNKYIAKRAGSLRGVWVKTNAARAGGTLTVTVYKNGVATALTAVLDGTNTTFKFTESAKDAIAIAAGDELDVRITTDAGWLPTTADIGAGIEIED